MKRAIAFFMGAACVFSLTACGDKDNDNSSRGSTEQSSSEASVSDSTESSDAESSEKATETSTAAVTESSTAEPPAPVKIKVRNCNTIAAGELYTIALKSDGTVVAVGYNYDGRCDVSDWTDIRVPQQQCASRIRSQ